MSEPLVPLVVIRDGQPWILRSGFSRSDAYRRHRKSLERFKRYEEMLQYLEHLVLRLREVATINRTPAATQEEWFHRSATKTQVFFEHMCVVHDLRRGVAYAARFLNTTTVYGNGLRQQQVLARRASRAIDELLFPPHRRRRGPKRLPRPNGTVQAIRYNLLQEVRQIWRVFDQSERRAALRKLIVERGWQISSIPLTVGRRPPTRVTDLVLSQHTGIGQKRLRPVHSPALATFIYQ